LLAIHKAVDNVLRIHETDEAFQGVYMTADIRIVVTTGAVRYSPLDPAVPAKVWHGSSLNEERGEVLVDRNKVRSLGLES
jgi:hypothetical protein